MSRFERICQDLFLLTILILMIFGLLKGIQAGILIGRMLIG